MSRFLRLAIVLLLLAPAARGAGVDPPLGAPEAWIRMEPSLETANLTRIVQDAPHPNAARAFIASLLPPAMARTALPKGIDQDHELFR